MSFFNDVSVVGGMKDLASFLRQSPKERIIPAILAIFIPSVIIFIFVIDSKINTAPPEEQQIIYFESWSLDRTDEEILADRWAIQCKKDELEAKRKENLRQLARASGMDAEEIEREAEAKRRANGIKDVVRPAGLIC